MNKFFLKNVLKAVIAAVLIIVMWVFQYYPESVNFKFWLGLVVVIGILCYLVILVCSLASKVSAFEKEKSRELQAKKEEEK